MSDNIFICEICKKSFKDTRAAGYHISVTHNITTQEYYNKFLLKENENKCKQCGKNTHFIHLNKGYRLFCSKRCSALNTDTQNKAAQTNMVRYGNKIAFNNKTVQEKYKQTCMNKYGVEWVTQTEEHKEKIKQTNLEKYGVTFASKLDSVKSKMKETCQEKYGAEWALQNDDIRKKMHNTIKELYGDEYPTRVDELLNKRKRTCIEKYGVEHISQVRDIKIKCGKKYVYDNQNFDSSWELAFYIWLKDNKINFEYHPNNLLTYKVNDVEHKYHPDFKIDKVLIEIKGEQFFDKNDNYKSAFEDSDEKNKIAKAKYDCMIKNNVKILRKKHLKFIFNYIKNKYGNSYLKQFKY